VVNDEWEVWLAEHEASMDTVECMHASLDQLSLKQWPQRAQRMDVRLVTSLSGRQRGGLGSSNLSEALEQRHESCLCADDELRFELKFLLG